MWKMCSEELARNLEGKKLVFSFMTKDSLITNQCIVAEEQSLMQRRNADGRACLQDDLDCVHHAVCLITRIC